MFGCLLQIFFRNVTYGNLGKRTNFMYFQTFEIENVGQGHGGEYRNLRRSIANV